MPHSSYKKGSTDRIQIFRGVFMNLVYTAATSDTLNADDPHLVMADVLLSSLEMLGSRPHDDEINYAARYLEGKEYVKVEWLNDGTGGFRAVRLLPKGMDLVEGSITDAGVQFNLRR